MDEAEKHAQAIIPQNAPLMKMLLFGMIPESIRFAFDLTLYPKWVNDCFHDRSDTIGSMEPRTKSGSQDRAEPVSIKFWKSRTDSDRSVPGPGGPWTPDREVIVLILLSEKPINTFETSSITCHVILNGNKMLVSHQVQISFLWCCKIQFPKKKGKTLTRNGDFHHGLS